MITTNRGTKNIGKWLERLGKAKNFRFIGTSFLSLLVTVCSPKPQTLYINTTVSNVRQDFLL